MQLLLNEPLILNAHTNLWVMLDEIVDTFWCAGHERKDTNYDKYYVANQDVIIATQIEWVKYTDVNQSRERNAQHWHTQCANKWNE